MGGIDYAFPLFIMYQYVLLRCQYKNEFASYVVGQFLSQIDVLYCTFIHEISGIFLTAVYCRYGVTCSLIASRRRIIKEMQRKPTVIALLLASLSGRQRTKSGPPSVPPLPLPTSYTIYEYYSTTVRITNLLLAASTVRD